MALKIGDKIPEIFGINQDGQIVRASAFQGKKLVLYFYPKDNTSGCTAEARSFRDSYAGLRKAGYEVVGVSVDSIKSHIEFIEAQHLPFDLIADTGRELVQKFDVWGEKTMYGKQYMGTLRTTFLINEDGFITYIFHSPDILTDSHANQILSYAKGGYSRP